MINPFTRGTGAAMVMCSALAITALGLAGCRTWDDKYAAERVKSRPMGELSESAAGAGAAATAAADPRALTIHLAGGGIQGTSIGWSELVERAAGADVVLIGETHGQPLGLAFAAALWEDALKSAGDSSKAALSLEFFERDEQAALDDYGMGITDDAAFRKAANRNEGNYPPGHAAMVDAAKSAKRPVIASNAPRRYVKLARTEGFERLSALSEEQKRLFDQPESLTEGRYRDEFMKMMGDMDGHSAPSTKTPAAKEPAQDKKAGPVKAGTPSKSDGLVRMTNKGAQASVTPETRSAAMPPTEQKEGDSAEADEADRVANEEAERARLEDEQRAKAKAAAAEMKEGFFRAQNVWDATMADSIARALGRGLHPVFHVVGQFHVDYDGGLAQRLRAMKPGAKVLTISVVNERSASLREGDKGRADVVVYVGE
ncbi:MAG TPA: ChaN family lipoprotein [Phycisphaerales bacterium]|nr:ChaN family lipoprotein [Phycisphaerales bacterium]